MSQIKTILIIVAVAICGFFALDYSHQKQQQLKNEAVDKCLVASGIYEYTDKDKGIKTTAPQKEYYKVCMADKGYSTIWE